MFNVFSTTINRLNEKHFQPVDNLFPTCTHIHVYEIFATFIIDFLYSIFSYDIGFTGIFDEVRLGTRVLKLVHVPTLFKCQTRVCERQLMDRKQDIRYECFSRATTLSNLINNRKISTGVHWQAIKNIGRSSL